jgi:hypothetical protein
MHRRRCLQHAGQAASVRGILQRGRVDGTPALPQVGPTVLYHRSGNARRLPMIDGAHAIVYSDDADATRAALTRVLGTRSVDAGEGWLIFALPPAEIAVHPADKGGQVELYLLCDDVAAWWWTCRPRSARGTRHPARPHRDVGVVDRDLVP